MKVVILAGGFGTRIAEYAEGIPKPMVSIGGKPIIWHLMNWYASYGHKDFFLALGHMSEVIKRYFLDYKALNGDCAVDLNSGSVTPLETTTTDWRVTLANTGIDSMTGGRVKRIGRYLSGERFLLTYGDGLADVDIDRLIEFHISHKRLVTVTAVRPAARFGELELNEGAVTSFKEKPQLHEGWINGGFFVVEPEFLEMIEGDKTILEKGPLETAAQKGELMAYRHKGFWQCMDTRRDRDLLESIWQSRNVPWAR